MSVFRLMASFFLFGSFFFLPGIWWVVLLLAFSLAMPFYFEGLFFALWYDLLYGPLGSVPATIGYLAKPIKINFFLFLIIALALLVSLFIRDRFSVGRARESYLR